MVLLCYGTLEIVVAIAVTVARVYTIILRLWHKG